MLSLIICLVIVGWLSVPCNALLGILAPRTFGVEKVSSKAARTPRPTPFFESVHKRDALVGYQTCGFVSGNHCKLVLISY